MTLHRPLESSPLGPAEIKRMTDAYEEALRLLRLRDRSDPLTELIAIHIVAITKTGERDPGDHCLPSDEIGGAYNRPANYFGKCSISNSLPSSTARM